MVSPSKVAEIGALLGDPARVNMMIALLDGRAWTARELADAAGVLPPTASFHLSKLVDAQMVQADRQGRHRYHRIASAEVAQLIEHMHLAGATLEAGRASQSRPRDRGMRELRSCYDHLAGRVSVELAERLLADPTIGLNSTAGTMLGRINIDLMSLSQSRRALCKTCIDWSERRPHIAGAVGAAILDRFTALGWVKRQAASRALVLTVTGERGLSEVFGVSAVRTSL